MGIGGLAVAYQGALVCRLHLPDGIEVICEKRLPVVSARSVISSARRSPNCVEKLSEKSLRSL